MRLVVGVSCLATSVARLLANLVAGVSGLITGLVSDATSLIAGVAGLLASLVACVVALAADLVTGVASLNELNEIYVKFGVSLQHLHKFLLGCQHLQLGYQRFRSEFQPEEFS